MANTEFACTDATAAGALVTCYGVAGPANPGPDVCSYSPPPYDVRATYDQGALCADAFDNYPLHT